MLLASLLALAAAATESAWITHLYEPEPDGGWARVDQSQAAWVNVDGVATPLAEGTAVAYRQHVATGTARAVVKLRNGHTLTLEPGSVVEIRAPAWVMQHRGTVAYKTRSAFTVDYGWIHCTSDSTRFSIEGRPSSLGTPAVVPQANADESTLTTRDDVRVHVDKGTVHMNNPQHTRIVERDHEATLPQHGVFVES